MANVTGFRFIECFRGGTEGAQFYYYIFAAVLRTLFSCDNPEGPRDGRNSISRGNIEEIKLSIRNDIFNREWFFHSEPLSGRRKTRPGIEFCKRECTCQTENEYSSENGSFMLGYAPPSEALLRKTETRSTSSMALGRLQVTSQGMLSASLIIAIW